MTPRYLLRTAAGLLLLWITACGGGSGGAPSDDGPPGFKGIVRFPGFDLGRVSEQEPNDTLGQPHALPPCWESTSLAVGGTLGLDAAAWGAVDDVDCFGLHALVNQRWSLELTFDGQDRVTPAITNEMTLQALDTSGNVLAETLAGPSPRTLAFDATEGSRYRLRIQLTAGNAAYELSLDVGAGGTATKPLPPAALANQKRDGLASTGPSPCADDHILIGFRAGCDADDFCAARSLRRGRVLGCGGWCVHFDGARGTTGQARARALAKELAAHQDVAFAEPDWIVKPLSQPNDELFPRQWNMRAIGAPAAWTHSTGSPSVVVGVIDTGVVAHPELAGRIEPGYDFVSAAFSADGDDRDPDPTDPGDELHGTGFSTWHGTHVSAIICAVQDNGVGGSGVAPNCKVMPLRAIGRGGGLVSDVADALLYGGGLLATTDGRQLPNPLSVINLSIGISEAAFVMEDAINRVANRGTFIVAAAGNNGGPVLYPAAYPSAFAVAAIGGSWRSTSFSNFGLEIELSAPGGNDIADEGNDGWMDSITSALMDETVYPAVPSHGAYVGTSQAAPHVSGAAALLLSIQPNLTRGAIRQYLIGTSLDLGIEGRDAGHGYGLLQVHEAVKFLLDDRGTPDTTPAKLCLPAPSIRFEGFSLQKSVPLFNEGGQRLELSGVAESTVNGGLGWLNATLDPAATPGGPVSHPWLIVNVDRTVLTDVPGHYTGHVQLLDDTGAVVGRVEVVASVAQVPRAGCVMRHVVINVDTGGAPRTALVRPEFGYRYWIKGMPPATYRLRAGEDLNDNGLYCEPGEACGYFGGPTESEAVPVEHQLNANVKDGLDIWMVPTAPP